MGEGVVARGWKKYSSIGVRWRLGYKLLRVHARNNPRRGSKPFVGGRLLEGRGAKPERFSRQRCDIDLAVFAALDVTSVSNAIYCRTRIVLL